MDSIGWLMDASEATTRELAESNDPMQLPFFYGWIIVAVTFVTMAIGVNARTAFSLFFPPIL